MFARKITAALGATALVFSLAACSSDESSDSASGDKGTINLGYLPSWTDGKSTAYLIDYYLTEVGYEVEHTELTEAAALYTGLANGDVDMYPSAWPEATHKEYMDKYSDKIEDLGAYYEDAKLTLAVPSYMDDINTIDDLKGKESEFDGKIIGIEPSAGLTRQTQDHAIPEYGLDYELVTSSTPSMLSELKSAMDKEDPIVVTLWRPFWAYSQFDVKDLEDPQGAMGGNEALHWLAKDGFTDEHPELAEWFGELKLSSEDYGELEDLVVNQYEEGDELKAVQEWVESHPDAVPEVPEA